MVLKWTNRKVFTFARTLSAVVLLAILFLANEKMATRGAGVLLRDRLVGKRIPPQCAESSWERCVGRCGTASCWRRCDARCPRRTDPTNSSSIPDRLRGCCKRLKTDQQCLLNFDSVMEAQMHRHVANKTCLSYAAADPWLAALLGRDCMDATKGAARAAFGLP